LENPQAPDWPADPDPHPEEAVATSPEAVAEAVCGDILAIQLDSYGRGAENAKAHVLDDTVIVMLDGLELLPNEEFMIGRRPGERGPRAPRAFPAGDRVDVPGCRRARHGPPRHRVPQPRAARR